jgi:hypothetical protein
MWWVFCVNELLRTPSAALVSTLGNDFDLAGMNNALLHSNPIVWGAH